MLRRFRTAAGALPRWCQPVRREVAYLVVRQTVRNKWLDTGRLLFHAKQRDLRLEVVHRPELPINAREAKVGDLIELTQRTKNGDADLVRRYFGLTEGPQRVLDQLTQGGLAGPRSPAVPCRPCSHR